MANRVTRSDREVVAPASTGKNARLTRTTREAIETAQVSKAHVTKADREAVLPYPPHRAVITRIAIEYVNLIVTDAHVTQANIEVVSPVIPPSWTPGGGGAPGPGGPCSLGFDISGAYEDLWYRLGFESAGDLTTSLWVTVNDLYEYADEAVKRLAYVVGMFKDWDSTIDAAPGSTLVRMPARHIFTVLAYLVSTATGAVQLLRLTNVEQLFALDSAWVTASGGATRLSMDAGGIGTATFYPSPVADATLWQVIQYLPPTVANGSTCLPIPDVIRDYFTYAMLRQALMKESDHARPEVADHCGERMALYEKVFDQYWGPGE